MLKVGRYTAALLLMTVGVMLFLDQTTGSDYLAYMFDWWPIVLIGLGVEYLLFNVLFRNGEKPIRLDMGGLILSVLISAVVVGVTQSDRVPAQWFKNLDFNIANLNWSFSSESGYSYTKEPVSINLPAGNRKIIIDNSNGSVEIRSGSGSSIEVNTVVWVDKVDEGEAADISNTSAVEYSGSSTLTITAKGTEYTGSFPNKRKPRMNLIISVPAAHAADYELRLLNGKLEATELAVREEMKASTTNGDITLHSINGKVVAHTTNGTVELTNIGGNVEAGTTNGAITATDVKGGVDADTTNGAVVIEKAVGMVDVRTLNGKITIHEAAAGIKADATNGSITVSSSQVGGDYDLHSLASAVDVRIPSSANVEVKASSSFGSVSTDLPFVVEGKKISGKIGSGDHLIKIETNNKIHVNKMD